MNDNLERNYWMQLFSNLVNASPVDTRNMQTHIVMYEDADNFVIEVNAPFSTRPRSKTATINGKSDYAYDVNYSKKSPHKNWIQNQINQTARIVNARVTYLGGE